MTDTERLDFLLATWACVMPDGEPGYEKHWIVVCGAHEIGRSEDDNPREAIDSAIARAKKRANAC